jgi:hypothetical protein
VNVIRHHHVAQQLKVKALANFLKGFQESVACGRAAKMRTPPIAGEGDEMQVSLAIAAFELVCHGRKAAPFQTQEGWATREFKKTRVKTKVNGRKLCATSLGETYPNSMIGVNAYIFESRPSFAFFSKELEFCVPHYVREQGFVEIAVAPKGKSKAPTLRKRREGWATLKI